MKKYPILAFLLIVSFSSFAQLSFGVKAGLNISTISISNNPAGSEYEYTTGAHIGVFAQMPVKGKLTFIPELQYSQRGTKIPSSGGDITFSYLELPLLFSFAPVKAIAFDLGPGVALRLSSSVYNNYAFDHSVDFGMHAGIRVNLTSHVLLIGRYYYGLTAIDEVNYNSGPSSNAPIVKSYLYNKGFQVGVGYRIK